MSGHAHIHTYIHTHRTTTVTLGLVLFINCSIHHGAVYGTLPWTKELKALASCRRFLRNSAVQAHVSSVRYVTLRCPVTAHAWNMLVYTNHPSEMENLSYDHLISLLINADSAVSIFSSCKRVSYSSCFWTLKHSN